MKVINRDKFIAKVIENGEKANYNDGAMYTIRKLAENTKEVRVNEDNKTLTLLGMNVYTVMYEAFTDAVKSEMVEINDDEYNAGVMIKELDANDVRINKK